MKKIDFYVLILLLLKSLIMEVVLYPLELIFQIMMTFDKMLDLKMLALEMFYEFNNKIFWKI